PLIYMTCVLDLVVVLLYYIKLTFNIRLFFLLSSLLFFFHDTATTCIYTLSLHDALPLLQISSENRQPFLWHLPNIYCQGNGISRSEEHTSELQSRENLVCRLLLEKKKICIMKQDFAMRKHKPKTTKNHHHHLHVFVCHHT